MLSRAPQGAALIDLMGDGLPGGLTICCVLSTRALVKSVGIGQEGGRQQGASASGIVLPLRTLAQCRQAQRAFVRQPVGVAHSDLLPQKRQAHGVKPMSQQPTSAVDVGPREVAAGQHGTLLGRGVGGITAREQEQVGLVQDDLQGDNT